MNKTQAMLRVEKKIGMCLEDYLTREYHERKKTMKTISEETGIKLSTLKAWFRRLGIKCRTTSEAAKLKYEGTSDAYRKSLTKNANERVREVVEEGTFWLEGRTTPMSEEERKRISERMRKDNPMFKEEYASKMRRSMEKVLRERATRQELSFKRGIESWGYYPKFQHAVDKAVVDFAFIDAKLAIEIDGLVHSKMAEVREKDRVRDARLRDLGWEVIRIPNRQVETNLDEILLMVVDKYNDREVVMTECLTKVISNL